MIFSNAHNFIFFHVPKTGGTSLSYALGHIVTPIDIPLGVGITMQRGEYFPLNGPKARALEEAWAAQWKIQKHSPMSRVRESMGPDLWARMRKIAFVRDPFSRAVSGFRYTCKSTSFGTDVREMGFRRFLESDHVVGLKLATMWPQVRYLDAADELDFLGYLETFASELNRLETFLDIPQGSLSELGSPKANATSEEDAPAELGEIEKEIIREIYAEDFAVFGYSPEDGQILGRIANQTEVASSEHASPVAFSSVAAVAVAAHASHAFAGATVYGSAERHASDVSTGGAGPAVSGSRAEHAIVVLGSGALGASSIERHFAQNAGAYREQGLLCPRALSPGALMRCEGAGFDLNRMIQAFREELSRSENARSAVITSEGLFEVCGDASAVSSLKAALQDRFDRVSLVMFPRRQDRVITDMHAVAVRFRRGGAQTPLALNRAKDERFLDFAAVADFWADAFGRDALHIKLVEETPGRLQRATSDLCRLAGVETVGGHARTESDERPSWKTLEATRLLNRSRFAGDKRVRHALWVGGSESGCASPLLTVSAARATVEQYAASNERLAREYLGLDASSPFDDDFTEYVEERPPLTQVELLEELVTRLGHADNM